LISYQDSQWIPLLKRRLGDRVLIIQSLQDYYSAVSMDNVRHFISYVICSIYTQNRLMNSMLHFPLLKAYAMA
jgi:hypothetical protein